MDDILFKNRTEAGLLLAKRLAKYKKTAAVVLGLPRGGMVTASVVAKTLSLPLGLVSVKKIGHPQNPEYAIGAVSESGNHIENEGETKTIDRTWLMEEIARKQAEAKAAREKFWGSRAALDLQGKTVIVVDDGVATGLTLFVAVKDVQHKRPNKIVVAVPVSPKDTAEKIKKEVDEFITVSIPEFFSGAVGSYYEDFSQVSDEEVVRLLGNGV